MEPGFVEVATSYSPLAVFYALVQTTIEIDDTFRRRPWGTHRFEVEPGEHTVAISFRWVFDRRCGRSRVTVTVRAGGRPTSRTASARSASFRGRSRSMIRSRLRAWSSPNSQGASG